MTTLREIEALLRAADTLLDEGVYVSTLRQHSAVSLVGQLAAALRAARQEQENWAEAITRYKDAVEAAEQRARENEKDAARYRWLRDNTSPPSGAFWYSGSADYEAKWNAAIDAARNAASADSADKGRG